MNPKIEELLKQIAALENQLKHELEKEDRRIPFTIEKGRVWFDNAILRKQKAALIDIYHYLHNSDLSYILTSPVIYAVIFPALLLDLFVTLYQQINFRVYRIPLVKRSDYIVFDRQYLAYLNVIEKLNCLYCSYFNGLMAYAGEVAARTEQFCVRSNMPKKSHIDIATTIDLSLTATPNTMKSSKRYVGRFRRHMHNSDTMEIEECLPDVR